MVHDCILKIMKWMKLASMLLGLLASIPWSAKATEIEVFWPIAFSQPHLQAVSMESKSVYWMQGSRPPQAEGGSSYVYRLPDGVAGRMLLTLYKGQHSSGFEHYQQVVAGKDAERVKVTFPDTSALFELKLSDDKFVETPKLIFIRRYQKGGVELDPFYCHILGLSQREGRIKNFGLDFADAGDYLICIKETGEAVAVDGELLYTKRIKVTQEQLYRQGSAGQSLDEALKKAPVIRVDIGSKDKPASGGEPSRPSMEDFTIHSVSSAGVVDAVYPPSEK